MANFAWVIGAVGIAAGLVFAGYVFWRARHDHPMRCPETGSVALVGVDLATSHDGKTFELVVRRCSLWPEKEGCAGGCLARYGESSPGFAVNLNALRPFDRR